MPKGHSGTAYFIDCHIESFPNNGLYGSGPGQGNGPGGAVHVIRGLFRNNNVSNVRVGSDTSSVIGTVSIQDGHAPINRGDNQRGVWVRETGQNMRIEAVDIIQAVGGDGALRIDARDGGGSGTIRDVRIKTTYRQGPSMSIPAIGAAVTST